MIKIVPMQDFLSSIGRAKREGMDLSLYHGHPYECACGQTHALDFFTELLCHAYWEVVAACPDDPHYLTRVKVKMFLMVKFLGFEGVLGTRISSEADKHLLIYTIAQLR